MTSLPAPPGRAQVTVRSPDPPTLTVGCRPSGRPVGLRTDRRLRITLVGGPGSGKTTACRRLIRRWLHFELGPVGVLTTRPEQYADLPVERIPLGVTHRWATRYPLVVADEADLLRFASVLALCRGGHRLVVVAGWGSHVSVLASGDAPELDRVLLVNHHPGRAFLHFPGGVPVLLDPVTRGDVDPLRRRTHLNGVLIEDNDGDDDGGDLETAPVAASAPAWWESA